MKNRIKEIRESMKDNNGRKLSQAKFAERLGVSISSVQKWEIGAAVPNSSAINLICEKCGVNETWLRTGAGKMHEEKTREEELGGEVARMLARPDSFKASVVAALLKFDPGGPEWSILERIYNDIADQWAKEKAGE
jgi:transcriptional regulator with XRE-family HTH domain